MAPASLDALLKNLTRLVLAIETSSDRHPAADRAVPNLREDSELTEHALHAEGAGSHPEQWERCVFPISLSRNSVLRMRTKAIVVEISRPSVDFSCGPNADSGGKIAIGRGFAKPCGQVVRQARHGARRGISFRVNRQGKRTNGTSFSASSDTGIWKPVTELTKGFLVHLLGLMRDHLAFAGFAHAIALDGLCQNDCRLPPCARTQPCRAA